MSATTLLRALAALPLFAAALPAQDSTVARDGVRPSSVAPAPVGARRDTAPAAPAVRKQANRQATRSSDDQVTAMIFTLGAAAIGGTAGSLYGDACFGDGEKMSGRAMLSGLALGVPASMLAQRVADRADAAPATPRTPGRPTTSRTGVSLRDALMLPVGGAAIGAVIGAPIGAVQGARHPGRCGGSTMNGTGRGAAQMAVGGAVVGAGFAAIIGVSEIAMRLADDGGRPADSVDARARRAGVRPEKVQGRQSPYTNAQLSLVIPGGGHVRAGEPGRGLAMAAVTYGLAAIAANVAPSACAESGAGEGCTRAQSARSTVAIGATALAWALQLADAHAATERRNRRLVEQATEQAGAR